ncbi:MAG: DEAD/DEAH box helicase [Mesorhizobium sp.]|uniref:DEAD/DEAH box helicase n=1 Tax=Mesorhizobium sp. TaxID=1871066 RepID=UPI001213EF57|nr:DEAD/DEAH box helicase [Mesorhizobium sp.]TIQ08744.1 MAG: DEAD/DEAH box helicase [Mesorhizobium sp.]
MKQFKDLGLAESLLQAVSAEGYTSPTPIQAEVIPAMLAERDVIGIAQTGTGKTASFVLPLLDQIARQETKPAAQTCGALILTPTRELAQQIAENIRVYGQFMQVSVAVVVGGVKPGPQIRSLASGADIVVATPGRLLDHMNTGAIRLDKTERIILDEADQMLDLGFMPAIRKIMSKLPKERQTVLMSATMPAQIRALACEFQDNPTEIAVAAVSRPIDRITQSVRHVPASAKRGLLTDILSDVGPVRAIVFTRTKRGADKVCRHLESAGLSAAAIHGNKSQVQRERTLASFRAGRTSILVATDIAARGIDIDDVSHVINYELPNVAEAYVHRIGRTARAGRAGIAISLCDPAERSLLRDIERLIGSQLEITTGGSVPAAAPAVPATHTPCSERKSPARHRASNNGRNENGKTLCAVTSKERKPGPDAPTAGLARMLGNIGSVRRQDALETRP